MTTIINRLAQLTTSTHYKNITENEKHQTKRLILDRLGSGITAARLAIRKDLINHLTETSAVEEATVRGTHRKTTAPNAALLNGAASSHLEYSPHNPMIPAALALAETRKTDGKQLLTALSAGYKVERTVNRLLASPVEKRGMHWPAYLAAFPATAACSRLLELSEKQTADALSLAGCISPATPFIAFTQGAPAKDVYDGWGSMLGVLSAQLGAAGVGGPENLFEGERGLGKMWLDQAPSSEQVEEAFKPVESKDIKLGIKPYPSCAAAHPTLTAIESLLK